jgi:hypothetical protein
MIYLPQTGQHHAAIPTFSPVPNTVAKTTTTAAPPPRPLPTASTTGPSVLVAAVFSGAVLAALITAAINIWLARRKSREEERGRLRANFADAFATCAAYKEFPYAIRRRRADALAEERVRLSEALREIQAKLAYHLAWTAAESENVGRAYADLVGQVRRIAGAAMHEAWNAPPITSDAAMNIPPSVIDLSSLKQYESAYMKAVQVHLQALAPRWGITARPVLRGRRLNRHVQPLEHPEVPGAHARANTNTE